MAAANTYCHVSRIERTMYSTLDVRVYELVRDKYKDSLLVNASVQTVFDEVQQLVGELEESKWAKSSFVVESRRLATGETAIDICRRGRSRARNAVTIVLRDFDEVICY